MAESSTSNLGNTHSAPSSSPMDQAASEALIRVSQRPSKSCTECVRRKTRCSKTYPCEPCNKRGMSHMCKQESQFTKLPPHSSNPVLSEIEVLRRNVYDEIHGLRKRIVDLETAAGLISSRSQSRSRSRDGAKGGSDADAATTLEFFALGIDRRLGVDAATAYSAPGTQSSPSGLANILSEVGPAPPESVTDSLLPREIVTAILAFHEQKIYWQHACVFFPDFWKQVRLFYEVLEQDGWGKVDGTWTALFYAMQAIAVHQMTPQEAAGCGLSNPDRLVLPNALVSSIMASLTHANFLARPTIYTCQTIAILALCGHNICDSDLLSSLLAIGIKLAQSLNLHSLGQRKDLSVVGRELGARVWWSLTTEDWFSIPFKGVWAVHPDHFDTPLPSNCDDVDMAQGQIPSRPDDIPTIGSKTRFSAKSASILQNTFTRLRHATSSNLFPIINDATNRYNLLISQLPPSSDTPDRIRRPSQPHWAPAMRHYLTISALHKQLVIYRAFLARGGTPTERKDVQARCVRAAEEIIDEMGNPLGMQAIWTLPYHTLGAAVVLALEMIEYRGKGDGVAERRREYVDLAVKALDRLADTSRIARRGMQVLRDLSQEADRKRKRGPDRMAQMVKKIRLPEDVRPESPSTSPHLSTSPHQLPPYNPSQSQHRSLTNSPYSTQLNQPPPPHGLSWSPTQIQQHDDPSSLKNGVRDPYTGMGSVQGASTTSSSASLDDMIDWTLQDTQALLASLQEVPDVGRLFDGSIGNFGFGFTPISL